MANRPRIDPHALAEQLLEIETSNHSIPRPPPNRHPDYPVHFDGTDVRGSVSPSNLPEDLRYSPTPLDGADGPFSNQAPLAGSNNNDARNARNILSRIPNGPSAFATGRPSTSSATPAQPTAQHSGAPVKWEHPAEAGGVEKYEPGTNPNRRNAVVPPPPAIYSQNLDDKCNELIKDAQKPQVTISRPAVDDIFGRNTLRSSVKTEEDEIVCLNVLDKETHLTAKINRKSAREKSTAKNVDKVPSTSSASASSEVVIDIASSDSESICDAVDDDDDAKSSKNRQTKSHWSEDEDDDEVRKARQKAEAELQKKFRSPDSVLKVVF